MAINYEEGLIEPPEVGDIVLIKISDKICPMIVVDAYRDNGSGTDWMVNGMMMQSFMTPQHLGSVIWKPAEHLVPEFGAGLYCYPKLLRGHAERIKEAEAIIEAHRAYVPTHHQGMNPMGGPTHGHIDIDTTQICAVTNEAKQT